MALQWGAMSDPRVYFAAERTLLAWIRTGLTIMGLGFVVARFGLFLAVLTAATPDHRLPQVHWHSSALGIALVLVGAASILGALVNHRAHVGVLPPEDVPHEALHSLAAWVAGAVALTGFLLAAYLAVS
jgi:putative membrane protein